MLQAKFEIIERCFQISRGTRIHEFPEKTFAAFEALAGFFALLFEQGDVVANGLNRFQQGGMCLNRFGVRGLLEMTLSSTSTTICATCSPMRRMTARRADCNSDNRALITWACWLRSKCSPRWRIHTLPSWMRLAN